MTFKGTMNIKKSILLGAIIVLIAPFHMNAADDLSVTVEKNFFVIDHVGQKTEEHKEKIENTVWRHRWMRIVSVVGVGAVASYFVYQLLFSGKNGETGTISQGPATNDSTNGKTGAANEPQNSDIGSKNRSIEERIGDLEKQVSRHNFILTPKVKPVVPAKRGLLKSVFSWGLTKTKIIGNSVGYAIAGSIGVDICKKLYRTYFHEDNIRWFVADQTSLRSLISQTKALAKTYRRKNAIAVPEDLCYAYFSLARVCKELVSQIELVIAFMEYAMEQFRERGAVLRFEELLEASHLIAATNKFINEIQAQFSETTVTTAQVKAGLERLLQFASDVEMQVEKTFPEIEDSIEDRLLDA